MATRQTQNGCRLTLIDGDREELEREALRAIFFGPPGAFDSCLKRLDRRGELTCVERESPARAGDPESEL